MFLCFSTFAQRWPQFWILWWNTRKEPVQRITWPLVSSAMSNKASLFWDMCNLLWHGVFRLYKCWSKRYLHLQEWSHFFLLVKFNACEEEVVTQLMTCLRRETYLADFISCGDCTGFKLYGSRRKCKSFHKTPIIPLKNRYFLLHFECVFKIRDVKIKTIFAGL